MVGVFVISCVDQKSMTVFEIGKMEQREEVRTARWQDKDLRGWCKVTGR
jgi:hypothetical protein